MAGDDENPDFRTQPIIGRGGSTTQIPGISGQTLTYLPGDIVDNDYQLTSLLGRGGMGAVFACKHRSLNQDYALKLLSGQAMTGEAWSRFQIEAKVLAKLKHPGIVAVYNMGIDKSQCPYYVMDLLHGAPLNTLITEQGQLPIGQALDIYIQVADALSSAHSHGVIHRDIKPSNLMVTQEGVGTGVTNRVKLVDFGIARLSKDGEARQSQTATGLIFGTPFYMSPEQCDGQRVDERSDIYSLGCALFETLTGQPPFVGDNAVQTFMMHQSKQAPTLASRSKKQNYPEALESSLQKMLAKNPTDRYQSMAQLKHDLERIRAGKSVSSQGVNSASIMLDTAPKLKNLPHRVHGSEESEPAEDVEAPKSSLTVPVAAGLALLIIGTTVGAVYVLNASKQRPPARVAESAPNVVRDNSDLAEKFAKKGLNIGPEEMSPETFDPGEDVYSSGQTAELKVLGATADELKKLTAARQQRLQNDYKIADKRMNKLFSDPQWQSTRFKKGDEFHFPDNVNLGAIQIGDAAPVDANGTVKAPGGEKACFYMITTLKKRRDILDKFGPEDLTGLAMVFYSSDSVIDKLKTWTRLEDLWFFNPLLKTVPNNQEWEQSDMSDDYLYKLSVLPHLQSLGLSYPATGEGIINMPVLRHLKCLRINHIHNVGYFYQNIRRFPNIKELWIGSQNTNDDNLLDLAAMPGLERLTIRRSMLTPGSFGNFQKMRHLKYLCLDRNDWTAAQKKELKSLLPRCEIVYEPVIDTRYWEMLPTK